MEHVVYDPVDQKPMKPSEAYATSDNLYFASLETQQMYYHLIDKGFEVVVEGGKPILRPAQAKRIWTKDMNLSRSSKDGHYVQSGLEPGTYTFQAEAPDVHSLLGSRKCTGTLQVTSGDGRNKIVQANFNLGKDSQMWSQKFSVEVEQQNATMVVDFINASSFGKSMNAHASLDFLPLSKSKKDMIEARRKSTAVARNGEYVVELTKGTTGVGMTLSWDNRIKSVLIRTIEENGAAQRTHKLKVGDRIKGIQGQRVDTLSFKDVIKMLRNIPTTVVLLMEAAPPGFKMEEKKPGRRVRRIDAPPRPPRAAPPARQGAPAAAGGPAPPAPPPPSRASGVPQVPSTPSQPQMPPAIPINRTPAPPPQPQARTPPPPPVNTSSATGVAAAAAALAQEKNDSPLSRDNSMKRRSRPPPPSRPRRPSTPTRPAASKSFSSSTAATAPPPQPPAPPSRPAMPSSAASTVSAPPPPTRAPPRSSSGRNLVPPPPPTLSTSQSSLGSQNSARSAPPPPPVPLHATSSSTMPPQPPTRVPSMRGPPPPVPAPAASSSAPAPSAGNDGFDKYRQMLKVGLPEGAVRNKAAQDGVMLPDSFFSGAGDQSAAPAAPAAPAPPTRTAAPPPPTRSAAPPPPPVQSSGGAEDAGTALPPGYEKYSRMQKAGLPEGAILQAMARDGVQPPPGFGAPMAASATPAASRAPPPPTPTPSAGGAGAPGGLLAQIQQGTHLKKAEAPPPPQSSSSASGGGGNDLLSAIQNGVKLKKAAPREEIPNGAAVPLNPLLAALQNAKKENLRHVDVDKVQEERRTSVARGSAVGGNPMSAIAQALDARRDQIVGGDSSDEEWSDNDEWAL